MQSSLLVFRYRVVRIRKPWKLSDMVMVLEDWDASNA